MDLFMRFPFVAGVNLFRKETELFSRRKAAQIKMRAVEMSRFAAVRRTTATERLEEAQFLHFMLPLHSSSYSLSFININSKHKFTAVMGLCVDMEFNRSPLDGPMNFCFLRAKFLSFIFPALSWLRLDFVTSEILLLLKFQNYPGRWPKIPARRQPSW